MATQTGRIDSLELIPGLLESLKIRALIRIHTGPDSHVTGTILQLGKIKITYQSTLEILEVLCHSVL